MRALGKYRFSRSECEDVFIDLMTIKSIPKLGDLASLINLFQHFVIMMSWFVLQEREKKLKAACRDSDSIHRSK
jgi:hypothetical protein